MKSKQNDSKAKLKSYHMILISSLLCVIFILNSNYVNEKRAAIRLEKKQDSIFNQLISKRSLEETVINNKGTEDMKESDKVCERGSDELKSYYKTGDLSKIELDDKEIKCEDKDKDYMKALIDLVEKYVNNNETNSDGTKKNSKFSIEEDKENIIKYLKHILPLLIFFLIGILSLIGWLICCFCNCCNCCCCCCCKKPGCKIPCFIFTYIFYLLAIAACIYGFSKSNKIFKGLSDTECSFLKLLEQVSEGEVKTTEPKWIGVNKINELLKNLSAQINSTKETALEDLHDKKSEISTKNQTFNTQLNAFDDYCYNDGAYPDDYTKEFNDIHLSSYEGKKYVLDIIKLVGHKDSETGKYPNATFLYLLNREYSEISSRTDGYVETSENSFKDILNENSAEVMNTLNKAEKNLNKLKDPFDKINNKIGEKIYDYSESIDKYGKLTVKLLFFILILINVALAILLLLICLCSFKACTSCCCCRCFCKFFTHLLWNILALMMFFSFFVGSSLALVGKVGDDAMSLVSYILSEENFDSENPFLLNELGDAKKYLNICLHGNGSLESEFDLGDSLNSIENIDEVLLGLDNVTQTFKNIVENLPSIKDFYSQIKARTDYTTDEFGLLGVTDPGTNIILSIILPLFNGNISASGKTESWGIDETSNTCESGIDTLAEGNNKFHISKCKPIDRDWIAALEPDSEIKNYAKMISEIVDKVRKLNDDESTDSFKGKLKNLNDSYYDYMDSYIQMVDFLKDTIGGLIGQIRNTVGSGSFFSFLNGKFIGTNIKIILKYLQYSLGEDIYNVGICLIIVGCSLILSISSTILLIVIINVVLEKNIKEERNNVAVREKDFHNSEERKLKY